jgi:phosphoenolpyruvate carboxylase
VNACIGGALGETLRDAPAVLARQDQWTAAQLFQRHVERQHPRLKAAAGTVADRAQFVLQVAQRPQLFSGRRHKTRVLQDPVRNAHFLRHLDIVLLRKRDTRSRQIVELPARCRGGYTLFD